MSKTQHILIMVVFAALLLAFAVHAAGLADANYIIVVGEKAPASDVVTGANFAASMRSALGVTYTSALDTQAYAELTDAQVADKTIVVIDGNNVRLLGSNPSAQRYFDQQGFDVQIVDDPTREDLLLGAARNETGSTDTTEREDEQNDRDDNSVEEQERDEDNSTIAAPPTQEQAPAPQLDVQTDQPSEDDTPPQPAQTPRNETAQPEREGVLVRVWHWFAGLF